MRIQHLLDFCSEARSFAEILDHFGLKDRVSFKNIYIKPLLADGKLIMTDPDTPTSKNQKYLSVKPDNN